MSTIPAQRCAFTLTEVAFSLAIVAVGILTMALFLPIALRAHQQARFQLYAGTEALKLVESFTAVQTDNDYHPEANAPWDTPSGYRAMSPDLEIKATTVNAGIIPIPKAIAYRLDSPNDEIRRLLDNGGNVYYANPRIVSISSRDSAKALSPVGSQRLIIGIVGNAQQNALPALSMKAWPYRVPYPSQPHGFVASTGGETAYALCSEQTMAQDPDMFALMAHDYRNQAGSIDWDGNAVLDESGHNRAVPFDRITTGSGYLAVSGYLQDASDRHSQRPLLGTARTGGHGQIPGWVVAKGYLATALWYAERKGLPKEIILGIPTRQQIDAAAKVPAHVYALRFLAHAGMCLTKHYSLEARDRREEVANVPGYDYAYTEFHNQENNFHPPPNKFDVTLPRCPSHPGLRLGIPIPGDDRWDPADPASVNPIPGQAAMVLGRVGVPSPFSLQGLWNLAPPLAGTLVPGHLLNWPDVSTSHPFKQPNNPDFDQVRWKDHFFVTHAMIVNWTETCLTTAMANATDNPYDWSVPRPLNRPLFTDHPLLQWDLFPVPGKDMLSGIIQKTDGDPNIPVSDSTTPDYQYAGGVVAHQWRPVAAQQIVNQMPGAVASGTLGTNGDTDIHPMPNSPKVDWQNIEGTPGHFNLTSRFEAAERCRELVFWTADWMSYVDCETAASAPVDASRYPRQRPGSGDRLEDGYSRERNFTQSYMGPDQHFGQSTWANDRGDFGVTLDFSETAQISFRNPELALLFLKDMNYPDGSPAVPTNHDVYPWTMGPDLDTIGHKARNWFSLDENWRMPTDCGYYPPVGHGAYKNVPEMIGQDPRPLPPLVDPKKVFSGVYGADRNLNNVLDRGPVPRSTRIQAVEIARFSYYDPRLIMSLR